MTVTYRRPKPSEARDFAAVHIACWREAYGGFVPKAILDAADLDDRTSAWQSIIDNAERFVVGTYDGGVPAGFIIAGWGSEVLFPGQDGHIMALYILRAHARRGIGRALMGAAASWWLQTGGLALSAGVLAANAPARAFYEALGGRIVLEGTFNWHGFDLPEVVYNFSNLEELAGFTPSPNRG